MTKTKSDTEPAADKTAEISHSQAAEEQEKNSRAELRKLVEDLVLEVLGTRNAADAEVFKAIAEEVVTARLRSLDLGEAPAAEVAAILSAPSFVDGVGLIAQRAVLDMNKGQENDAAAEIARREKEEADQREEAQRAERRRLKEEAKARAEKVEADARRIAKARDHYAHAKTTLAAMDADERADLRDGAADKLHILLADGTSFLPFQRIIAVEPSQLEWAGDRVVFTEGIVPDTDQPEGRATEAWLIGETLIGDHAALLCEIPGGIPIGGGRPSALPARSLIF